MAYEFIVAKDTVIGENSLEECSQKLKIFGKKALIVTGKVVSKLNMADRLKKVLQLCCTEYFIFDEITGEPTVDMINSGVKAFKENHCDFIIGFGGGSPLDSAKAIAAMSVLGGEISDYMGKEIDGKFPPFVLIPTTSGTGSETTKFTIITDTEKNVKMLLKGNKLLPDLAILDYTFSLTSPKGITAATGMDALTHAVEAYTSVKANPITDEFALSAIKKIFKYLPIAYENPTDKKAREEMALASYEAGICINNSSVTVVHGMSRPIGALFHVPHGISNAMLISECLKYVCDGNYEKFGNIGRAIGVADSDSSDEQASILFIDALENLCKTLGIPSIEEYGIDKKKFLSSIDKMAHDAFASGSPSNTKKSLIVDDIIKIYKNLL